MGNLTRILPAMNTEVFEQVRDTVVAIPALEAVQGVFTLEQFVPVQAASTY